MYFKLIGSVLVICSTAAIGFYFSSMIQGRIRDLIELKKTIYIMRGDIQYGNTPLPEAISSIGRRSRNHFKQFFLGVSEGLMKQEGETFFTIWSQGVEELLVETYLTKKDKESLSRLGEHLGYLDKQMQLKTIDLYVEQLEMELKETTDTMKDKMRLYNTLGVLSGIFITIILL